MTAGRLLHENALPVLRVLLGLVERRRARMAGTPGAVFGVASRGVRWDRAAAAVLPASQSSLAHYIQLRGSELARSSFLVPSNVSGDAVWTLSLHAGVIHVSRLDAGLAVPRWRCDRA